MTKQGSCLEKEIMQGTMPGARSRGRPRTAWMDNIETWTGLSVEESIRMTDDRDKWRRYVHGVANPRIEDGWRTELYRISIASCGKTSLDVSDVVRSATALGRPQPPLPRRCWRIVSLADECRGSRRRHRARSAGGSRSVGGFAVYTTLNDRLIYRQFALHEADDVACSTSAE